MRQQRNSQLDLEFKSVFYTAVDLVNKSDPILARVESTLINSGVDHGHGKSNLETNLEQEDLDPFNQSTDSADTRTVK